MKDDGGGGETTFGGQRPLWERPSPPCATVPVSQDTREAGAFGANAAFGATENDAGSALPVGTTAVGGLLSLPELSFIESFLCTLPTAMVAPSAGPPGPLDDRAVNWPPSSSPDSAGRPPKALLEAHEKRTRHVQAEHKRRNRIKDELGRMARLIPLERPLVPATSSADDGAKKSKRKSQARLMGQANDYIEQLVGENQRLRHIISILYRP